MPSPADAPTPHTPRNSPSDSPAPAEPQSDASPSDAIVVLGCRVRLDRSGRLVRGVLSARVEAAAAAYAATTAHAHRSRAATPLVVASGGRSWSGQLEADVMGRELSQRGVPEAAIVLERASLTTRENARFTARLLFDRGLGAAAIVTSDWHLPRALALFRKEGVRAVGVPASSGRDGPWPLRIGRRQKERFLTWYQTREKDREED